MLMRGTPIEEGGQLAYLRMEALADDGATVMSHGTLSFRNSVYAGSYIRTMCWQGIRTDPRFRRMGCVRKMMEEFLPRGRELGACMALLHPFSYSYYRRFGFERVSDTVQIRFPINALDFLPRCRDLVPLNDDDNSDALPELFNAFSLSRNLMFRRYAAIAFRRKDAQTYLYMANGRAEGYITFELHSHFNGCRVIGELLNVLEIGFLNRDALRALLGFLRMYEGEFETVAFHDVGPVPEIPMLLQHNAHTQCTVVPDIMARVLDTEAVLKANRYPEQPGAFTIAVDDWLENVRGVYYIEYGKGKCMVERRDSAAPDLTVQAPALARLLYGYAHVDAATAPYLEGLQLHNAADDFFRAFPHRVGGVFEHF
jgi:predicted acetyltransferase